MKSVPRAKPPSFYKIILFTEKNKNIYPSYFYPVNFSQKQQNSCRKYSHSLWKITTGARSHSPRE